MVIALAGYRGFIGSKIIEAFSGHEFILLNRDVLYGSTSELADQLQGVDIVMNFAGNNISRRWTKRRKKEFYRSRVTLTRNLVKAINSLDSKPDVFVNSSAIGIYEFDHVHTEEDYRLANNDLSHLVKEWELSADQVSDEVKLIKMRLGMVLGKEGGALPRLLGIYKLGLGGKIASGKQVYSFIHIDDVSGALLFLIQGNFSGIFNLTVPEPISNAIFSKTLAKKLKVPAFFSIPKVVMRIMMGKASSIVTMGQTVLPKRLLDNGYKFTFANIDDALENLLSRQ